MAPCPRVTTLVREGMMKFLKDLKEKSRDSKRKIEKFEAYWWGDVNDDSNEEETIRQTIQESIRSHKEWEERQRFRSQTGGFHYIYEESGSSHAIVSHSRGRGYAQMMKHLH